MTPDSYSRALGAAIRQARIDAGQRQKWLACKAGVTQPAISFYEQGTRIPRMVTAYRIASALWPDLSPGMALRRLLEEAGGQAEAAA